MKKNNKLMEKLEKDFEKTKRQLSEKPYVATYSLLEFPDEGAGSAGTMGSIDHRFTSKNKAKLYLEGVKGVQWGMVMRISTEINGINVVEVEWFNNGVWSKNFPTVK